MYIMRRVCVCIEREKNWKRRPIEREGEKVMMGRKYM